MNQKNAKNKKPLQVIKLKLFPLERASLLQGSQQGRIKTSILAGLAFILFFLYIFGAYVFAVPPGSKYNPGETLEPACSPGDTNCTVYPPVSLIDERGAINTTTPGQMLVVQGTSTTDILGLYSTTSAVLFFVDKNGKVGIGTSSPDYLLDVYGTSRLGSGTSTEVILRGYVQSDIIPYTNEGYILGSSDSKWQNLYAATGTFGSTITVNSTDITADGALNLTGAAASTWKTNSGALTIESADALTATSTGTTTLSTGGADRMTILSTGEVGIGTTTPSALFEVFSDSSSPTNLLRVSTGTAEALFIDELGVVGIGTTTPASGAKLDVAGDIVASLTSSGVAGTAVYWNSTTRLIYAFTSSLRFKEKITDLEIDSSKIFNLRPVSFTPIGFNEREFGFIAEEVYQVMPELVSLDAQGKPFSVNYSQLGVLLLNEMKKQKKELEDLKLQLDSSGSLAAVGNETINSGQPTISENFLDLVKKALEKLGLLLENGIAKLNELFVQRMTVRKICLEGEDGETICIDKNQLKELLQKSGTGFTNLDTGGNNEGFSQESQENSGFSGSGTEEDNQFSEQEPVVEESAIRESLTEESFSEPEPILEPESLPEPELNSEPEPEPEPEPELESEN